MPEKLLLTGISGFIAKRIAADLLNAGYQVRGTLRSPKRADEVRAAVTPALADPTGLDERLTFAVADLTQDDGWPEAMAGVSALVHTASPFPLAQPRNEDEVIGPAVDGTRRALTAAHEAGVARVVLTSSMVAIMHGDRPEGHILTEADWSDLDHPTMTPYAKSKTLAEREAWKIAEASPGMALTTINPGLVAGTPMDAQYGTSLEVIERFLSGKDPAVPNFGLPVVDIADVSAMHLAAVMRPETAGKRYIASDAFCMAPQMAGWLADAYPERKIARRVAPRWLVRLLALANRDARSILPQLDQTLTISNTRARREMGIDFTPAKDAVLASAAFLAAGQAA